jgi:RHS repeat-associated protein
VSCSTSTGLTGVTGYTHDLTGNMVSSTDGLELGYNAANQTVDLSGLDGQDAGQASYAGVGQAERVSANQQTFTTAVTGVTAARQGTDAVRWVRDPAGNVISQRGADGTRVYYLTDGLGSTTALVDDTGQVRTRYRYSPYGETEQTCHGDGCVDNPWRYTGEYQDDTGMYKIGERYLAPALGRWTQADPAAFRINPSMLGEPSPYAYAGCNPINNTDPTGLWVECTFAVAGGVFTVIGAAAFAPATGFTSVGAAAAYLGVAGGGAVTSGAGIGFSCLT